MMKNLLKLWIFISALSIFQSKKTGEYLVVLESVDNFPNASREFVDWHLSVKRINKDERVVVGYYQIKKDVVHPKIEVETYFLSNNMFLKVNLNHDKSEICQEPVLSFLKEHFEGNSTTTEDCIFKPGYMRMKKEKPLNMDELCHRMYKRVFYGTFKVVLRVLNEEGSAVIQFSWTARTLSKD